MYRKILILFMILLPGCSELVNLTGIFINRAADNENISKEIILSVLNSNGKMVLGFNVSILEDKDSVLIFNPIYTTSDKTLRFNLPDEQINSVKSETQNLIIVAEHPYIGIFQQLIPIAKLHDKKPLIIEFIIGEVSDTLSAPPYYLYKQFRN